MATETPPLVSQSDVAAALPGSTLTDFTSAIEMGHAFIASTLGSQNIDGWLLRQIELAVVLDIVEMHDTGQIKSETRSRASITYQTYGGAGYKGSKYWDLACKLDPTGILRGAGKVRILFGVVNAP